MIPIYVYVMFTAKYPSWYIAGAQLKLTENEYPHSSLSQRLKRKYPYIFEPSPRNRLKNTNTSVVSEN